MLLSRFDVGMLSVGLMVLGVGVVSGQDYPNRPIRIITANAGGGLDLVARVVAQSLPETLHQQVVVDNRTAIVLGEIGAKASPDGYSLIMAASSFWILPLMQKVPYNPADFLPITLASKAPNILVVHPGVPVKSVKELIDLAKAQPGELNYASGPNGGGSHLAVELFKYMAGVNIVRIAYKGGAAGLVDLLGGRVQMTIDDIPTLMPNVKAGKLVALAVTSAQPAALAPGLPTVTASGVPGYEAEALQGLFAPAKTPEAIIRRLNQEIVRVLRTPEAKAKLLTLGYETVGSTPEEFAAIIKSNGASLGKLIKDMGMGV